MGRCCVRSMSFHRSRQIAYGAMGVVLGLQWLSIAGLQPAGAQADGAVTASDERPAVVLGNARADSALAGVSIRNGANGGGLNIGFDMGVGLVTLKEDNATANSTVLDLTAMYQLFGPGAACPGRPPKLASRPPTAISNSSAPTDTSAVPAEVHYPGLSGASEGAVVGTQVATSSAQPMAAGTAVSSYQDYGFFRIYDGRSEATTSRIAGVREARGVVSARAIYILGGALIIKNPKWEAIARDGTTSSRSGTFTSTGGTLFGVARTHDQLVGDLRNIGSSLGWLLGSLGFHLDVPTVEITTVAVPGAVKGETRVRVTPLVFRVTDAPAGEAAIKGLLTALDPWIKNSEAELNRFCDTRANVEINDILMDILSGTGSISMYAGGVTAATDDSWFATPVFDTSTDTTDTTPVDTTPSVASAGAPSGSTDLGVGVGTVSSGGLTAGTDTTSIDTTSIDTVPIDTVPIDTAPAEVLGTDETASPVPDEAAAIDFAQVGPTRSFRDGTRGGRSTWVGLLALAGVAMLAAGDHLIMKRGRRVIPS